jgi:Kef-type K+ transport system membrane component KefB
MLAEEDDQELGVRISLAPSFFFIALSELVHLESVLGTFMGGALLSVVFRRKGNLERKLSGIGYGFLIPIFFINVGINFDLSNILTPSLLFTLKLLIAALAVKIIPSLLYVLNGVPWRQALTMGVSWRPLSGWRWNS